MGDLTMSDAKAPAAVPAVIRPERFEDFEGFRDVGG